MRLPQHGKPPLSWDAMPTVLPNLPKYLFKQLLLGLPARKRRWPETVRGTGHYVVHPGGQLQASFKTVLRTRGVRILLSK